ncbi:MAG: monovalent cation/H+ antiporter subunit A [Alphaproteobacteria bacterium]|nr:monovalent cation/H+ antiporter subunit A [Alphaproteobacteria bacterium]MCW5744289.1 monovalent cation/H+ antiporter subunit A [Alphaproteobacteria bacterium]
MEPAPLIALLLTPFVAAPLVAALARRRRRDAAWAAAAAKLVGLALLAPLVPGVLAGDSTVVRLSWLPEWGLDIALRLDGLGLMFALLILGIGLLIVLYAAYYLPEYDRLGRFYALLLTFAGGMLGVVLAENLILMLVFWEVTSLTSFLLIAYKYEAHDARIAARMALAVTGAGGLALLAGFLLLGYIAGSFELSEILRRGDAIRAHPLYPLMLVLILLAAFTKSAQFPFHFWLPNAMAAPTPVSAYLHSATMVKAGVFLLARFYPVLSGTDLWLVLVGTTGAVTFAYGAYVALLKHDFKGLLAYSTISHLGLITLLFGLGTSMSAVAAVFHIINHAIFKASLFMAAGIIDHECGTRDMRRINGLFKYMPWTGTLAILAAGSMAGVPLLNGFLSKEMFFTETVGHPAFQGYTTWLLPAFATIAGMLSVAYSARFVHDVFFNGEPVNLPRTPHEPARWMRLPVEVLVVLVLLVGLLPQFSVRTILTAAAEAVLAGAAPDFKLAVWHGWNLPLTMSIAAFGLGLMHYWRRRHLFDLHERYAPKISSPVAFERVYREAGRWSSWLLHAIDNRSLQRYLTLLLAFVVLYCLWAWWSVQTRQLSGPLGVTPPDAMSVAAFVALAVGAVGTVAFRRQRLVAVIFMSVVGLVVALAFIRFKAPDLALTQLSVEVVTIVLLLLALRFLPGDARPLSSSARRSRDAGLALLGGGGVAALAYAMLTRPFETISGFHLANAVPGGGGSNVVNVILVDFRGFDTLGEIAVLAMAALGLHALLDGLRLAPHAGGAQREADRHPIMLAQLMRPLLPLALAVAVYIFLRGHNLPGGGFIAGLIAAVALMLQYLAGGIDFATARLRADYVRVLGVGLSVATATGVASWLLGYPFLTSTFGYVHPPVIEKFELASAMAFDLGVFLVVVASVLLALSELGTLSRREASAQSGKTRP